MSDIIVTVDVDAEWADVANALGESTPAPKTRSADLSVVMANVGLRQNLRRFLIAAGAISTTPPPAGSTGTVAQTNDVVGQLISAPSDVLMRLMASSGVISSPARVSHFAAEIGALSELCDPADAASVARWVTAVGRVLRDHVGPQ
jgi:hypothetical protein